MTRPGRRVLQSYGVSVAGVLALLTVLRPHFEGADCRGERVSFATMADRRGINADYARALRDLGFTTDVLCEARHEIVQQAIRSIDRAKTGKAKPDSPGEYLEFRKQSLRDENGEIDPDGLMRAKAHVDRMRALTPPAVGGITRGAWTSIGPGNIGGRIRAMVIRPSDPDTIFIGSVGGGIWKTANGGTSWSVVDDFMANLAVSTMVIDPSNANTMYAGTGEGYYNADGIRGAGIFKSTDGGTTWTQLASTSTSPGSGQTASDYYYVNRLAMNSDGTVLLAATRTGIYRSTDGGVSFARATMVGGGAITIGDGSFDAITDVDFKPGSTDAAVAATFDGTAFYSTTGGSTWTAATGLPAGSFRRIETAFGTSTPGIVYASVDLDGGSLYRSIDSGASYGEMFDGASDTTINPLSGQGWYDNMLFVSPVDANFVVWGGVDLWRSTNGGGAFSKVSQWFSHNYSNPTSAHADQHIAVPHPSFDGSTNKTVFFGNDGGVYKATDVSTVGGGSSPYQNGWTELNNGLAITQFYGGAGHASSGKITGGTQDNGTLLYSPGLSSPSENWTAPFGGDGGFSAYDSADSNYFYGEYVYALVHRNTTGGSSTSSYIYSGITGAGTSSFEFITAFIKDPGSNDRLLVPGFPLWRTNTAKASTPSWEIIKNTLGLSDYISAIGVAPQDSNVMYAGHNSGRLYKTTTATSAASTVTSSWQTIDNNGSSNPLPNRRVTRVTVDPSDANIAYVTFGGFSGDNVYKTTNGGTSWTNITGPSGGATALPDVPVRDLEINPSNTSWLYAGTEVGVFASTDGGTTWSLPHDGPANVSVDELFYLGTKLYAVTHGRGMFYIDTASAFTDSPLTAGVSVIKALHITELRTRVNAQRVLRGLGNYTFTDESLTASQIKAVHILELRSALAEVYQAIPQTAPTYTDAALSGVQVKTVHIEELRSAVIAIGG